MKRVSYLLLLSFAMACSEKEKQTERMTIDNYPETQKVDTVDTYFGTEVADPYRWLEDDRSAETEAWVEAQNEVTFGYLNQIPFRGKIKDRLTELWNYSKEGSPRKHGEYYYTYKNDGLQNQWVVHRKKGMDGEEEVFLDPNTFSEDATTSLAGTSFTEDGSLLAYLISEGGSDWRKIIVMNTEDKSIVEDTLKDVKFSGASWKGNDGFFYSSYDKPKGSELSAKTQMHKLYYHKLGTPQSEDELIFGGEEMPRRYIGASVSEDNKFLFVSASESTSGNELYLKRLDQPNSEFKPVVTGFDSESYVAETKGDMLYIVTNMDAPNKRLVKVDSNNPAPENWVDVIPETDNVLSVGTAGGYIFANYLVDVKTEIYQYDFDGKEIRKVELPGIGTAGGFGGEKEDTTLFYSFTSFTYPSAIFQFDIESGESKLYWKPAIDFNPEAFETKQVFYESKDGTKIPMFITHKKGLELNGKNPTYLYAYGGFNVSLRPSFSVARLVWLEQGGIYAQPNLRGGGEYGEAWHKAGTKMQKQNVFDDFIAAAEYLKAQKYTDTQHLAISGGSNGGLLVGATMTQRPDLCQVALPAVGVMDMLRYHTFTAGAGWAYDYGTSEDSKEMFEYLYGYSPVHNIKEGVEYPATLVTTADHDDRVVPAHSFKFAANLQEKHAGENPVLIRIETNAGHGAGKPTDKIIDEQADKYAFTWYNMGVNPFEK
ncbi:prolyl oligopeptidase family serine peptidase [Marivirga atlantica]|jgi:prolyl oligopeptidase|uniref:prolyl oligopeptidase n=1 Tax=Marivirga atlantica TaxID=1548457 RepID=A0A937A678_9BACT|nr:prolyl oligopeptidase family serine peptidase [Marivirga atlantica]MBL0764422.1 S9 family peptidase [Marivirga atlantica]